MTMHFTIPEVIERKDHHGSTFNTYEIHLNGVHHCSVRYRQLHNLHQQLRRELQSAGMTWMPMFPPKKLMMLTAAQLEERKHSLERYLQLVSQDVRLSSGLSFNGFLLASQIETWSESDTAAGAGADVDLDIYLMNDQKYTIRSSATLQTEGVLEEVGKQLGIPKENIYCFGLYIIKRERHGKNITIVRKFQAYESPYISLKSHPGDNLKLVLRKSSWDPKIDDNLITNKTCLNMLYIQTLSDVEHGWLQASADVRKQLASMQARGAKLEYMEMARTLKDYGYQHFSPCICDYPVTNSKVEVLIGGRELILRVQDRNGEVKERQFKVTRMRCWRIMSAEPSAVAALTSTCEVIQTNCQATEAALELSFEYLMPATREMQWISITSPQSILMSLCLQAVVEELLRMRNNQPVRQPGDGSTAVRVYQYKRKDGIEIQMPVRCFSAGGNARLQGKINLTNNLKKVKGSSMGNRQYSVKSLSEQFDVVHMKEASLAAEDVLIENEAFQEVKEAED